MQIEHGTLFQELFAYYRSLAKRRWQYLAVAIILTGFLFNARNYVPETLGHGILTLLTAVPILLIAILLQLLSRMRSRINDTAYKINELAGEAVLSTGTPGSLGLGGITFWVYLALISLAVPWFYLLFLANRIVCLFVCILFVVLLSFLRWRLPGRSRDVAVATAEDVAVEVGADAHCWSEDERRLHVVLFSLCYPAVLGTFFFTLFPAIAGLVTDVEDISWWGLGKLLAAALLVFHFIFDFVYTSEVEKYSWRLFCIDFFVLISFFVAYRSLNLGVRSSMDIQATAVALSVTYLLFRLWAGRVGGAIGEDKGLRNYEFGAALGFLVVSILAGFPEMHTLSYWLLTGGLFLSAIAMWRIAPRTLRSFQRRQGAIRLT